MKGVTERDWKVGRLLALEACASRLLDRIDEAGKDVDQNPSKRWAAVKRASLDLNVEAIRLRKGYSRERRLTQV